MKITVKRAAGAGMIVLTVLLSACGSSSPQAGSGPGTPPPVPAPPPVSLEERIDSVLDGQLAEESASLRVSNVEGIVLLTGQVLSEEAKRQASNAAAFSGGGELRRLVNELRVVDEIDLSMAEEDERLAASVQSLLAAGNLDQDLEVVVENATVYLVGRVSREAGEQAANLISRLEGVGSIRTVYEYSD